MVGLRDVLTESSRDHPDILAMRDVHRAEVHGQRQLLVYEGAISVVISCFDAVAIAVDKVYVCLCLTVYYVSK